MEMNVTTLAEHFYDFLDSVQLIFGCASLRRKLSHLVENLNNEETFTKLLFLS